MLALDHEIGNDSADEQRAKKRLSAPRGSGAAAGDSGRLFPGK